MPATHLCCSSGAARLHPRACRGRIPATYTGLVLATIAIVGRLAVLVLVTSMVACIARDRLVCDDDSQCSRADDGVCLDGSCAYPDPECPSGLRFSSFAGDEAGRCVESEGVAEETTADTATTNQDASTTTSDETTVAICFVTTHPLR